MERVVVGGPCPSSDEQAKSLQRLEVPGDGRDGRTGFECDPFDTGEGFRVLAKMIGDGGPDELGAGAEEVVGNQPEPEGDGDISAGEDHFIVVHPTIPR